MTRTEWAESLKQGDCFAIRTNYGLPTKHVVARVTSTQIIEQIRPDYAVKYNKKTQRLVGDSSSFRATYISPWTEKDDEVIFRHNLLKKVSNFKFESLGNDKLQKILEIMEENKG